MTVSFKLLNSFVKAVELESISSAAAYLISHNLRSVSISTCSSATLHKDS